MVFVNHTSHDDFVVIVSIDPFSQDTFARERVLTEWIDTYDDNEIIMRSMVYKDHLITAYAKSNRYNGTEGELYVLSADPNQWCNLWNDPGYVSLKADLLADMNDNVPAGRNTALEKIAPV